MVLDTGEIQSTLAEDLKATCDKCVFLGLEVLETQGGAEDDDEGEVYFETKVCTRARGRNRRRNASCRGLSCVSPSDQPSQFTIAGQRGFRQRGKKDAPQSLRERSRFVRAEAAEEGGGARGRWLYREGTPEGEGYKGNQAS